MSGPQGKWNIIANGFQGILKLVTDNATGEVTGSVQIDGQNIEILKYGFWDEAEQRIIFQREVKAFNESPQNYYGYAFNADARLFDDNVFGASEKPRYHMLAGSFDGFGTGGNGKRPMYGWVARQSIG